MSKYKVVFYRTTRYEGIIEAANITDAKAMTLYMNPVDSQLNEDPEFFQFELMDIQEIEEEDE